MKFYDFPKDICPMCNYDNISCNIFLAYPCRPSEMICHHSNYCNTVEEVNDLILSVCAEYDIEYPKELYLKEENFFTPKGEFKSSFTTEQKEFFLKLKDIID